MMIVSENLRENEKGDFVSKDGRVFRPRYGDMLKKMPKDIVRELAQRRLEELQIETERKELQTGPFSE